VTLRISEWLFWLAAGLGAVAVGLVVFLLAPTSQKVKSDPNTGTERLNSAAEREAVARASRRLLAAEERLRAVGDIPDATERSHALAGALRREMRGGHVCAAGLWAKVILLALLVGLLAALTGCIPKAPPVFSAAVPEMTAPEYEVPPATADACPQAEPYIPGDVPPHVTDGVVSCRAQVVPEHQVIDLLHSKALAEYYEDVAGICRHYRDLDRQHCEAVVAQERADSAILRRQITVHQLLLPVAVVAALFAGFIAGGSAP
jgi:hypothetical protein